ncbi:hypothetical protein L3X38_005257 [Prunus dulcis]|uniref:Uncharacterized protein n=1 Tax=Prunus dulcis TaxID=3755 RepID=A0AAD5F3V8_PRUDU|nr:hypothetical protein L3X38_005257 [Prunus dulcis]
MGSGTGPGMEKENGDDSLIRSQLICTTVTFLLLDAYSEFQENENRRKSLMLESYGVYSLEEYEDEGNAWSYACSQENRSMVVGMLAAQLKKGALMVAGLLAAAKRKVMATRMLAVAKGWRGSHGC